MCGFWSLLASHPWLFIATLPAFTHAVIEDDAPQSAGLTTAPIFATPLHEEMDMNHTDGAVSPPVFIQSFESIEETLPFQLSITDQPQGNDSSETQMVVATPVVAAQAHPSSSIEETREELIELEIKAELKWARS